MGRIAHLRGHLCDRAKDIMIIYDNVSWNYNASRKEKQYDTTIP